MKDNEIKRVLFEDDFTNGVVICILGLFILLAFTVKTIEDRNINYAKFGLQECQRLGSSDTIWQKECFLKDGRDNKGVIKNVD